MGYFGSQTNQHSMMILTIILIFFSFNTVAHISTVSDDDSLSGHNAYPPESLNAYDQPIVENVSGGDDESNEEPKQAPLLQNFRLLLGLKNYLLSRPKSSSNGHHKHYISPSPSPSPFSEVESLSPSLTPSLAPMSLVHVNPHPERHAFNSLPRRPHMAQRDEKGKAKRVLIAVIVSIGGVTLIGVVFLVLAWNKYKKRHNKHKRRISVYGRRRDRSNKRVSSHKSASKVSLNPGLDLFYLDSLDKDLEIQPSQASSCESNVETQSSNCTPKNAALFERDDTNGEPSKPKFDHESSSSTREITSVHEDIELVNYEYGCLNSSSGDKIIPTEESRSSDENDEEDDDQSFHSLVQSNSSSAIRLSNASLGSFSDAMEDFNSCELNKSSSLLSSPSSSIPTKQSIQAQNTFPTPILESPSPEKDDNSETTNCLPIYQNNPIIAPPPPPPPPLPLPSTKFGPSRPSTCLTRNNSIASSSSSTLPSPSPKDQGKTLQLNEHFANSPLNNASKPSSRNPSGIPPPPCPPPLFRPNANSLKTPPPPPSQLPSFSPLGKDGSPLPKLKPLHWDKVRAAPDQSMVWDKLRSSSFELDEEMIESLFGYNLQNSMKNDEAKSKTPSPSKHVLEPKRLQNITILSKALNVTSEQVCGAILQGNGLSLQQLEALVKMAPTKEEEAKLSGYRGNVNELGSAEKFVRAMLDIQFAFQRIEAMLYRETFEDEVVHLRNSYSMVEEACKELRSSRLFLKLLEAVLKTGNRMNVGTIRGGARAFKLDALLKLADVKGTDGKTNLLHFVVQEIIRSEGIRVSDSIMGRINQKNRTRTAEEKEEDYRRMGLDLVSGLSTELYNVKRTAAIDLDVLVSSVSNLSEGMAKLQQLISGELSMDDTSINFVNSMNSFLDYAERRLKEIKGVEDEVMSRVKEVSEYFHGNVSKEEANPLRIFVIVRDFLGMLDHVCKELRAAKTPRSPNPLAPFR